MVKLHYLFLLLTAYSLSLSAGVTDGWMREVWEMGVMRGGNNNKLLNHLVQFQNQYPNKTYAWMYVSLTPPVGFFLFMYFYIYAFTSVYRCAICLFLWYTKYFKHCVRTYWLLFFNLMDGWTCDILLIWKVSFPRQTSKRKSNTKQTSFETLSFHSESQRIASHQDQYIKSKWWLSNWLSIDYLRISCSIVFVARVQVDISIHSWY